MTDLDRLLGSCAHSGLHHVEGGTSAQDVADAAGRHHLRCFALNLHEVTAKKQFLQAAAEALHFPRYFGENWDAFEECVNDLAWAPAEGYVILVENAGAFINGSPAEWKTAEAIFQDAANHWRQAAVPFFVFLVEA